MNVGLLDIATKKLTWATDLKWEAYSGNFSPDGKKFTYAVNEGDVTDASLAKVSIELLCPSCHRSHVA